MSWKKVFKKGQELTLVTSSINNDSNANIVISLGFVDERLLIADAQMKETLKNLKENKKVCVVGKLDNEYYRVKGVAEISNSGKYFEICSEADRNYPAKNAIIIEINEVFDLDNVKRIL